MSWNKGETVLSNISIVAQPAVPIGATNAHGLHLQDDSVFGTSGNGDSFNANRSTEFAIYGGLHHSLQRNMQCGIEKVAIFRDKTEQTKK
jgi:hypothetical protein